MTRQLPKPIFHLPLVHFMQYDKTSAQLPLIRALLFYF